MDFYIRGLSSHDEKKLIEKYNYIPLNNIDDLIKWYFSFSDMFTLSDYNILGRDEIHLFFPDLDEEGDVLGMVLFSRK